MAGLFSVARRATSNARFANESQPVLELLKLRGARRHLQNISSQEEGNRSEHDGSSNDMGRGSLEVKLNDLYCKAELLSPDLRGDINAVVTLYRRSRDARNSNSK